MKIYSLQEENEKLKAKQGIYTQTGRNVFEAGRPSAPVQRKKMPAAPAHPGKTVPSPAAQRKAPQQNAPQRKNTARGIIGIIWFLIVLFLFFMGFLKDF